MRANLFVSPFVGSWTYTSFINNPDPSVPPAVFGSGTIVITPSAMNALTGTIGGEGWGLKLRGSTSYGNPNEVRFQGTGKNGGEMWVYDYIGYLVPNWPNGVEQVSAFVGSVVRTVPHSDGNGGIAPAGVVASFIAIQQPAAK